MTPARVARCYNTFTKMAMYASVDAVKRKIQSLQQVAYEAEDRLGFLQMEADMERQARQRVTLTARKWHLLGPTGTLRGAVGPEHEQLHSENNNKNKIAA